MKTFTFRFITVFFMVVAVLTGSAQKKVAYLTSNKAMDENAAEVENDPIIKMLQTDTNFEVTVFAVAGDASVDLTGFDLAVVQEGFGSSSAILKPGGSAGLANISIPFIYNKPYAIRDTRAVTNGSPSGAYDAIGVAITVDPANQANELFNGITITDNAFNVFNTTANDDGGDGDYALMYVPDVTLSPANTLLGTVTEITSPESTVFLNDFPAGAKIGSETTQARMIAFGMSFGAICKNDGDNITINGLTLWRNALYSLAGFDVPTTPVGKAAEGEAHKVAYLTSSDKFMGAGASDVQNDPIIRFLLGDENFDVTVLAISNLDTIVDLTGFHLAVVQESFWSTAPLFKPNGALGLSNINIPFIFNKAYAIRDGRALESGSPNGASDGAGVAITVDPQNQDNELFNAITFNDNKFNAFNTTANDDGTSGDYALTYVSDVTLNPTNTLLATIDEINTPESSIFINDFPAGSQIGSETTKARMVTFGMNFGAICKDNGDNLTTDGLTLWRNALYSLADIKVPDTPAEIKPSNKKVAYITSNKTMDEGAADPENDPIIKMLQADDKFELTIFAVANDSTIDLTGFDVAVVQEGFGSTSPILKPDGSAGLANIQIPFIFTKMYAIRDGRGVVSGSPSGAADASGVAITVDPANQDNELFNGIAFTDNTFNVFNTTASDEGGVGEYALNYVPDVTLIPTTTLLGTTDEITSPEATVFVNDFPEGATIGSETLQARMIALGLNFGAICKDNGYNLTSEGLTLWRNAIYSLAGFAVPTTLIEVEMPEVNKSIILLTDTANNGGDVAQYDWLIQNGFEVTKLDIGTNIDMAKPSQEIIDTLNSAGLVIIGRDANSSKYDGIAQDVIDSITAPVITNNPWGARYGNPKLWFKNPQIASATGDNISLTVADDPIFNFSHVDGDSINYANANFALITTEGTHNGTVLGSIDNKMAIIRFAKDVPYNDSPDAKTPKSERTIFSFDTGSGTFTLTPDGQAAYYCEICRMMGLPIEAPSYYITNNTFTKIILLTDTTYNGGGDVAQFQWLKANGFNVTKLDIGNTIDMTNPGQDVINQLNLSDLVIVGRDAFTSKYDGAGQDVIDNITVPVISNNIYGAKYGNPKMWFKDGLNPSVSGENIALTVVDDPIFEYANVDGDSIIYANGSLGLATTEGTHNGTIIGSIGEQMAIVRFAKNVPYNDSPDAKTPKSDRTLFSFNNGLNSFTLSRDGQAAYYAEICRLVGNPIEAPSYCFPDKWVKEIVLLTDTSYNGGGDIAQYEWLMANGFNVTKLDIGNNIDMTNPGQDVIDQMNAADLVIVGRDAFTSKYDGVGQDMIDDITVPVISNNVYGAKYGNPKMWFKDGLNPSVSGDSIALTVADDPIFTYANVDGDSIIYASGELGLITTEGTHNGSVIGSIGEQMAIVRFAKNVPYNDSPDAKIPKSDRTLFSFNNGMNSFTLTNNGQAAYYAEILRLLGLPIEEPEFYFSDNLLKEIIILTDVSYNGGGDVAQYEWLKANGFNVKKLDIGSSIDLKAPGQDVIDQMNAADLVIVGRDAFTSKYDGTGQDVIDNITVPVISNNVYGAKYGNPKMWFKDGLNPSVSGDSIALTVADDPIFTYADVVGDSIIYASGGLGLITTEGTHNGSVIGSIGEQMAIVRFVKNVPYNDSPDAKTPKSDRTLFSFNNGMNSFTLTNNGQAAYYAEILRLMGCTIEAPRAYYKNPASTLASLETSVGSLSPVFDPETFSYTIEVPSGTTSLTLTATATDAGSTVTGEGECTVFPSIVTINVLGADGVSTDYKVNLTWITKVNELSSGSIAIYPNPARDYIMFDGLGHKTRVYIYSSIGQVVSNTITNNDKLKLNISNFKPGIYLVRIDLNGVLFSSKFIKH